MFYVEAPNHLPDDLYSPDTPTIFLAGGITDCPDWQADTLPIFYEYAATHPSPFTVYNPRRQSFPIHDPSAAPAQIEWEHSYLTTASVILFYFSSSPTSPQPIVLLEYGLYALATSRPVAVGVDPTYSRILDVQIQTQLSRPSLHIHSTLPDTVSAALALLP